MKGILLVATSFVVALSGCSIGADRSEDYFPLVEGNRWVWVGGVVPYEGDTITWEVEERVARSSGDSLWKVGQKRFWLETKRAIKDSINLERKSDLLLVYKNLEDPDPDTIFKYPLLDGKEWTVGELMGAVRTAHISGTESVKTPYGKFANAVRIDCEDRKVPGDSVVMKRTDWYVRNVGRVMARVEFRGLVWEMKLTSMELH